MRKYSKTRVLIDYDHFNAKKGNGVLVCMNEGVLGVIRVLVESYGRRDANWVTAHHETGYESLDDAQTDIVDEYISEFLGDTGDMTFCEDLLTAIGSINETLQSMDTRLLDSNSCSCGQSPCVCNPEVSGPPVDVPGISLTGCCPPDGFGTFDDYQDYFCAASNWIIDTVVVAAEQMRILHFRLFKFYAGLATGGMLSVTEIYQKIAFALPDMFHSEWLNTITNEDRAVLVTELTDRYTAFQQAVVDEVPETTPIADVIDHYWNDTWQPVVDNLVTNHDAAIQDVYDATDTAGVLSELGSYLSTAAALAAGYLPASVGTIFGLIQTVGLANNLFQRQASLVDYKGSYVCTGDKCTCVSVTILEGTDNGDENYSSVFTGGWDQVQIQYYWVGPGANDYCGPSVTASLRDLVDWVATGVGNDFSVIRQTGATAYQGDIPWDDSIVGGTFLIRSNGAFSVTLLMSEDC